MSETLHDVLLIGVMALVTLALRGLPFLLFPEGRPVPRAITRLSRALPGAVMGMLVVYCLRNIQPLVWPCGLPELLAVGVTVGIHLWRRNSLLSILAGTACYMLLIQVVF